jgi:FkbM family methyltransferase
MLNALHAKAVELLYPYPLVYKPLRSLWRVFRPEHEGDALRELAEKNSDVFFIQIGANDGVRNDFLREYVLKNGWRGILVEPIPYLFEQLRANYSGVAGLIFENKAIAEQCGSMPMYRLAPDPALPPWSGGLASFDREHFFKECNFIKDPEKYLVTETIQTTTVEMLLQSHQVTGCDLIVIDTEGYDYKVLKQFDLKKLSPALVVMEHKHLSEAEKHAALEKFADAGYAVQEGPENFIARAPAKKSGFIYLGFI